MNMKRRTALFFLISLTLIIHAEAPAAYYSSCIGKSGQALLKALAQKIGPHTNVGYDGLWDVYRTSDVRPDGTLWDIYSTKQWPANFTRCGNYSVVGDCVNREHSLPKSWWGGGKADQYSDAFHLYPTDGKVNGQRSNYPFGECAGGSSLSSNGNVKPLGRLGSSTFTGYTGTVFEPDDEYKGDLARSYFYMAAAYNDLVSGWRSGNGSAVFDGNSYPVFTSWTQALLLKWARQDQVSEKESNRNEAIYAHQHNRNPFIDHPELIEYIWGEKVGTPWYPGENSDPSFILPLNDSDINLGLVATNIPRSVTVTLQSQNLTEPVTASATGNFSVTPASIPASQANAGTILTVTANSPTAGDAEGILTLRSGNALCTVNLMAEVTDGMPLTVTSRTDQGFTLGWVNLHASTPGTRYTLLLKQGPQDVPGYPLQVEAAAESYTLTGLDPSTEYTVTLTDIPGSIIAPTLTVRTADPVPYVYVLFDGTLHFDAIATEPSEVAELLIETENIDSDLSIQVDEPFQISTDKSSWDTYTTLAPEEDRFYLRIHASTPGEYSTSITVQAGTLVFDDATATATVKKPSSKPTEFLEDWEGVERPNETVPTYSSATFEGTMCRWAVSDGGFGTGSQDTNFNGTTVLRMGKTSASSITMAEDKDTGLGTVTFDASKWPSSSEATATVALQYSTDSGITWTTATTFQISPTVSTSYTYTIDCDKPARIRLQQTSGARWLVDNIAITDCTPLGAVNDLDYHTWDAYCLSGQLIIESRDTQRTLSVYSVEGINMFSGNVSPSASLTLPHGLYIVTDGNFSRRVLIK